MSFKSKVYKIAVKKRESENDFFWKKPEYQFHVLNFRVSKRYWMADPFLYEYEGIVYVFYELWDYIRGRGVIGYSIINDDFSVTKPKIIINENFHLSFPHIFDYNGEIYIIPESCGDGSVALYKAESFPNLWTKCGKIIQSINSCDSIVIREKNNFYLHTCIMGKNDKGHVPSCYVRNAIYPIAIPDSANKEFGELFATDCGEGDYGMRNAGAVLYDSDIIYRVGQDCRNGVYGKGICLYKVCSINPYEERFEKTVTVDEMVDHVLDYSDKTLCGFHTYNVTKSYEVIDIALQERIPSIYKLFNFVYKCFQFGKKILRKFFK